MVSMKMEGKEVHIDSYFSLLKGLLYNVWITENKWKHFFFPPL
jgi:hypothetical protein